MAERMTNERWAGLKAAPMWGKGEREAVRNELDRARREEVQQQDRIHALEVQQADLIRQAKEKDGHISELEKSLENARKEAAQESTRLKAASSSLDAAQKALDAALGCYGTGLVAERVRELAADRDHLLVQRDALTANLENARKERDEARAALAASVESTNTYVSRCIALRDEVDRLKPSGQVAEDVERVEALMRPACAVRGEGQLCDTCDGHAALSHLAAKAKGYEAAVADNAALVRILAGVWRRVAAMHYEGLGLKEAIDAEHPGAALLEAHKTALALLRGALVMLAPHNGDAVPMVRARDWHSWAGSALALCGEDVPMELDGLPTLLEEHRKALVRARNEGLEKAKREASRLKGVFYAQAQRANGASAEQWQMAGAGAIDIANAIETLKEHEQ